MVSVTAKNKACFRAITNGGRLVTNQTTCTGSAPEESTEASFVNPLGWDLALAKSQFLRSNSTKPVRKSKANAITTFISWLPCITPPSHAICRL